MSEVIYEEDKKSNCCGASIYSDTDICSECKEHCEAIEDVTNGKDRHKWLYCSQFGCIEVRQVERLGLIHRFFMWILFGFREKKIK